MVDGLIKEVSKWALDLLEQVLVYDGWWDGIHKIWKAVREAK